MPGVNSFAGLFSDAQRLLDAVDANAEQIPEAQTAKAELESAFSDLKAFAARRDNFNAEKQALSQQLKEARGRTQEKCRELRGFLVFKLGMRNERLVEFKVPPRRLGTRRTGSKRKPAGVAPAANQPASQPAATSATTTAGA